MNQSPLLLSMTLVGVLSMNHLGWAQTSQADSAATDKSSQTRELFRKGIAAYNSGQIEQARELFLQTWALRPSADVAMELAQTEMDLGKYADAAEHLDYALHNFTPSINDKMRDVAKKAYQDVLPHVAKLNIMVNQEGAEIWVKGRRVGTAPLSAPVFADPGSCLVEARFGNGSTSKTLIAETGKEMPVSFVLQAPPVEAQPAVNVVQKPIEIPPKPPVQPQKVQRNILPAIVGGAVALVGVGVGVGLRLASNSEDNTSKTLLGKVGVGGCAVPGAKTADCAALMDSLHKTDRERNWSTAGFVVGGAALVGTAVYWFWPKGSRDESTAAWRVNANVGSSSNYVSVEGSF